MSPVRVVVLLVLLLPFGGTPRPKSKPVKVTATMQSLYNELAHRAETAWNKHVRPEIQSRHGASHADKYNVAVLVITPVQRNSFPYTFMLSTWHFGREGEVYLVRISETSGWAIIRESDKQPWQVSPAKIMGEDVAVENTFATENQLGRLKATFFAPTVNAALTIGPLFRIETKDD